MKISTQFVTAVHAFVLALFIVFPVQAEVLGEVARSVNMPDYPAGTKIHRDTRIRTQDDQRIAIRTSDGNMVVANPNAEITLREPGFFSHLFGKIYYWITPQTKRQVTVKTRAATIGIRGTKFVVDAAQDDSDKENVSLVEGKLNFQSNDDQKFELYHERELTEFEQYKRQQMAEFQAFKQQMMEEFVAYKASIDLDAGYSLRFDGKKVVRAAVSDDLDAEVAEFERFLAEQERQ